MPVSTGGGRASTVTTRTFAKSLYRWGERKGEYTRLDWSELAMEPPSVMRPVPKPFVDTLMLHHWSTTQSCKFQRKEHINLLELEMIKQELKDRVNSRRGFCRVVNLCDSRVIVGAWAKGRSSSKQVNHRLRSCLPWTLVGDLSITNIWTDTKNNPADYPSRGKPIPKPSVVIPPKKVLLSPSDIPALQQKRSPAVQSFLADEATRKMKDTVLKHNPESKLAGRAVEPTAKAVAREEPPALRFREIFAGKAALSKSMEKVLGVRVGEPVDIKPHKNGIQSQDILDKKFFEQLKLDATLPNQLWHFGLPCSSFSVLQHSNGGTRRRWRPQGDMSLEREIIGNEIFRRTMILIDILEKHGNHWSLENPASSYVWLMPKMMKLCEKEQTSMVGLHQCAYGLKLPDKDGVEGPCKKPTQLAGNMPGLKQLCKWCTCNTSHIHAVGGVRTKAGWKRRSELAGHYPKALCQKYASIVSANML